MTMILNINIYYGSFKGPDHLQVNSKRLDLKSLKDLDLELVAIIAMQPPLITSPTKPYQTIPNHTKPIETNNITESIARCQIEF